MTKRDELEFLPAALEVLETPPRPIARWIAITIAAFFIAAVAWGILGHIDTVAVATGKIVPSERVKIVQPLENGTIRAILVRDGQAVRKGDVLVELDPTEMTSEAESVRSDLVKAWLQVATSTALLAPDPPTAFATPPIVQRKHQRLVEAARARMAGEMEKLRSKLATIDAEIAEQQAALLEAKGKLRYAQETTPLLKMLHDSRGELYQKQLLPLPEWLKSQREVLDNKAQINASRNGIVQAEARLQNHHKKREAVIADARAEALTGWGDGLSEISKLEQQLVAQERRLEQRSLKAPIDGTVFGLAVHTIGGVVTTKDTILQIVPAGATLEVEANVLNKDIGFVQEGQEVEIKIDTFPFTRYGLIDGKVEQIWRDAIQDEELGLVYKAEISLADIRVRVGSRWQELAPGMSVQAEVKTGSRRVISFFLSPFLRYRDEALRER